MIYEENHSFDNLYGGWEGVLAPRNCWVGVQRQVPAVLAGYLPRAELTAEVERFLVAPRFGATAGLIGAFALAQDAAATGQARA